MGHESPVHDFFRLFWVTLATCQGRRIEPTASSQRSFLLFSAGRRSYAGPSSTFLPANEFSRSYNGRRGLIENRSIGMSA
jgi:hypothetical protein